jgi:hypothetical protein
VWIFALKNKTNKKTQRIRAKYRSQLWPGWSFSQSLFLERLWKSCYPEPLLPDKWSILRRLYCSLGVVSVPSVRSLAFLGKVEVPEANTKTRPPDLWLLAKLPYLFLRLQNLRNFHN